MRFGHWGHWGHWEKRIGGVTVALLVATGAARPAAGQPPELVIEVMEATAADESMAAARARIEQFDRTRLLGVMRLVGLDEAGPPIHVILAPARSDLARSTPRWIGGFAVASAETLVLFPGRAPSYPHNSLDALLQHEVAHILIGRAAEGRYVPRWFNEGLAMAAERTWALEDTTRLAWEVVWGGRVPVAELDPLFEGTGERPRAPTRSLARSFVICSRRTARPQPAESSRTWPAVGRSKPPSTQPPAIRSAWPRTPSGWTNACGNGGFLADPALHPLDDRNAPCPLRDLDTSPEARGSEKKVGRGRAGRSVHVESAWRGTDGTLNCRGSGFGNSHRLVPSPWSSDVPQRVRRRNRPNHSGRVTEEGDEAGQVFHLKQIVDRVVEAVGPMEERERNEHEEIQPGDGVGDQRVKRLVARRGEPS